MPASGKLTGSAFEADMLQRIAAAVAASDLVNAAGIATRALNKGMRHPILFNARGLRLEEQGHYEEALMEYRAASLLAPSDAAIHNAVGLCLINLNRLEDAVQAFETAIAHQPFLAVSHYRRGWALGMMGDHERAQTAHERAISLDAFYMEPMTSMSSILCRRGEIAKARYYAESALLLQPSAPSASLAMAVVELAERSHATAEQRLRALFTGPDTAFKARAYGFLGDALHAQNRFAEAFDAYTTGNDLLQRLSFFQANDLQRATRETRRITSFLRSSKPEDWSEIAAEPSASDPRQHIFVVGFMRSGTTLLEQVLTAHLDIKALDERDILAGAATDHLGTDVALAALEGMSTEALAKTRDFYWDNVRKLTGNIAGKIFVDKLPFNALKLPLIAKLFPKAKIIVAIRDPRDVVLSCFRQHLEINVTPPEFLSLTSTAELYSETMALIQTCQDRLPISFFSHRHENLVEHFDDQLSAVCNFIGIAPVDSMRNFTAQAPAIALRSPSAPQIRRGLNMEGIGQWRNYAAQLSPVLPLLSPWIQKLGYVEK